jgi:hypothetical protein
LEIKTVKTAYLVEELETDGHSPMRFLCDDFEEYYVKYRKSMKKEELDTLVYEVAGSVIFNHFSIPTPEIALVEITAGSFDPKQLPVNRKYTKPGTVAFGSKKVENSNLYSDLLKIDTKRDFNRFERHTDLIIIALIDLWMDNTDRKEGNYNLLTAQTENKRKVFVPIDNAFAFGGYNSIGIFKPGFPISCQEKLVSSDLFRSFIQFVPIEARLRTLARFRQLIDKRLEQELTNTLALVPESWKISRDLEQRILKFLFNKERIHKVVEVADQKLKALNCKA